MAKQFFNSQSKAMKTLRRHGAWQVAQMDQAEHEIRRLLIRKAAREHKPHGPPATDTTPIEGNLRTQPSLRCNTPINTGRNTA